MPACAKCNLQLDRDRFHADKSRKSGLQRFCKDCSREYRREWLNSSGKNYSREWRQSNRERVREHKAKYIKARRDNPRHALDAKLFSWIRYALLKAKKPSARLQALLGYLIEDLRASIETEFSAGMSWENWGEWHLDHRVPLASFSYVSADDPQFRAAWSLTNLRPLWADENVKKGCRTE